MATSAHNDMINAIKRTPKTMDNLKEWLQEKGIKVDNLELLVQEYFEDKVKKDNLKDKQDDAVYKQDQLSKLMDLMVLNNIQKQLQKLFLDAQESSLLQTKQDHENPLIETILTKENLSKAGKRDLDDLNYMCHLTGVKPVQDFEENIFVTTQEAFFESDFLNERFKMVEAKNNQILQPLYQEKQSLKTMLQQIYEAQVYPQRKELAEVLEFMRKQNQKQKEEEKTNKTKCNTKDTDEDKKLQDQEQQQLRIKQLLDKSSEYTQAQVTLQSCEKIKYKNFAGLPSNMTQARVVLASFQDEIIAKELKLKQLLGQ